MDLRGHLSAVHPEHRQRHTMREVTAMHWRHLPKCVEPPCDEQTRAVSTIVKLAVAPRDDLAHMIGEPGNRPTSEVAPLVYRHNLSELTVNLHAISLA